MHPDNCVTNPKKVISGEEVILNQKFVVECSIGDEGRNLNDNNEYWTEVKIVYTQEQAEMFIKCELLKYKDIMYYRWVKVNKTVKYFNGE
jgi:hypothetical protein